MRENLIQSWIYKWIVLATVSIINFLSALDISIITISFPRLVEVFQTDASVVVWLSVAYSMADMGLLLTLAKVADNIGRKKVFTIGLMLYTMGLLLCSLSPNISLLILSRTVQGAGAAMTVTVGSAIVVAAFPKSFQGRAIGIFNIMMSVGLIAGPALGGLIIDYLDWRGLFYTRIPISLICLILTMLFIKEQKASENSLRLDISGSLALLGGTGCLLLFLNLGSDWGYLSARSYGLGAIALILFVLFFLQERKADQPVLDLSFFTSRVFTAAIIALFAQALAGMACTTVFPFLAITGLQLAPTKVGMIMLLIALPPLVLSPISGWVADKVGNQPPMLVGVLLLPLSLILSSRFGFTTSILYISLVMLLYGSHMGIFMAPNQSAVLGAVPRQYLTSAIGIAGTVRLLGAAIGTAGIGTLYNASYNSRKSSFIEQGLGSDLVERLAVVASYQFVLLIAAGVSLFSVLATIFIREEAAQE